MIRTVVATLAAVLVTATINAAPPTGSITINAFTCVDQRWFEWYTTEAARWDTSADLSEYDMEAWVLLDGRWQRWSSVPAARGRMSLDDVPAGDDRRFMLREITTGEREEWVVTAGSAVSCSVMPPPNGAVWKWTGERFDLVPQDVARQRVTPQR